MGFIDRTTQPTPPQWLGTAPPMLNPETPGVVRRKAISSGLGSLARTLRGEEQARRANVLAERRLAISEEGAQRQRKTAADLDLRRKSEKTARKDLDEQLTMYQSMDVDAVPEDNVIELAQEMQNNLLDYLPELSQKDARELSARTQALPMMQRYAKLRKTQEETRVADVRAGALTKKQSEMDFKKLEAHASKLAANFVKSNTEIAGLQAQMQAIPADDQTGQRLEIQNKLAPLLATKAMLTHQLKEVYHREPTALQPDVRKGIEAAIVKKVQATLASEEEQRDLEEQRRLFEQRKLAGEEQAWEQQRTAGLTAERAAVSEEEAAGYLSILAPAATDPERFSLSRKGDTVYILDEATGVAETIPVQEYDAIKSDRYTNLPKATRIAWRK